MADERNDATDVPTRGMGGPRDADGRLRPRGPRTRTRLGRLGEAVAARDLATLARMGFVLDGEGMSMPVAAEAGGFSGVREVRLCTRAGRWVCYTYDARNRRRLAGSADDPVGLAAEVTQRLGAERRFVGDPTCLACLRASGKPVATRLARQVWDETADREPERTAFARAYVDADEACRAWAVAVTLEALQDCGATRETIDEAATARLGGGGEVERLSDALASIGWPVGPLRTVSELMEPVGYGNDIAGVPETRWERAVAAPYLEAPWYRTTVQDIYEDPIREAANDGVERMLGVDIPEPGNPAENFAKALQIAQRRMAERDQAEGPDHHPGHPRERRRA